MAVHSGQALWPAAAPAMNIEGAAGRVPRSVCLRLGSSATAAPALPVAAGLHACLQDGALVRLGFSAIASARRSEGQEGQVRTCAPAHASTRGAPNASTWCCTLEP
jgi:hypothetical protein